MTSTHVNTPPPCILYVDDEHANRVVFEQSFAKLFRICVADSADAALEILKTESVGVVVTDQRMPGTSGNDLLVRVKELYPEIVRVVITAYGDLDALLRAVNNGLVARYIVKPWDRNELEQLLIWSMQAFFMGRHNEALQLRLIQTERLMTLGSIHASVIHDIKQPLGYMLTNAQRLTQLASAATDLKNFIGMSSCATQADRDTINEIATDLPAIAKDVTDGCNIILEIANGVRKLVKTPSDNEEPQAEPTAAVHYAMSVCREIALQARGTLSYDGPSKLPLVRMGSVELMQVLINVVSNAAHALGQRDTPGGRVVIRAFEKGGMVCFAVIDDGPGMSPEALKKVGTPFYSTRENGTGLGVSQCRRIIEGAHGVFTIESQLGRGTTVTIGVPRSE